MAGRECYHCKQWIEEGEEHDCWTTTETALTRHLSEDLREAWERLRETAASFGDQRIYASHKSIMFSRSCCYFFVRPKRSYLEVCVFLGRTLKVPQVRRLESTSKSKVAHFIRITHRDEVETPISDWLREAYEFVGATKSDPNGGMANSAVPRKLDDRMAKEVSRSKSGTTMKRDSGKQFARLRRICLSIPGTIEKLSHGEPTFFTPKRVFAMFANNHHGDGRVAVWLPAAAGVQDAVIEEAPETYFRPPYVGGSGWIGVQLSEVDDEQLGALIREAFQFVDRKSASSRGAKSLRPVDAESRPRRKKHCAS
jgi:hypothetical protein